MSHTPLLVSILALTVLAGCTARERPTGDLRNRTIAFDNVYGAASMLTVYVVVDGGSEQTRVASCKSNTCSFELPLTNGPHTLLLAVEQGGKRSTTTTITVDTSNFR